MPTHVGELTENATEISIINANIYSIIYYRGFHKSESEVEDPRINMPQSDLVVEQKQDLETAKVKVVLSTEMLRTKHKNFVLRENQVYFLLKPMTETPDYDYTS